MVLGNSNGKNKGKKYLKKKDIDYLHPLQAEKFNQWFTDNANDLIKKLISKKAYIPEIFNDTYLKIYEYVIFSGKNIENLKSYFFSSYLTNYVNTLKKENKHISIIEAITPDIEYQEDEEDTELIAKKEKLQKKIMEYVYQNYELHEFELFKMYIFLKPHMNYKKFAEITNIKFYIIQNIISRIRKDIAMNEAFQERRNML